MSAEAKTRRFGRNALRELVDGEFGVLFRAKFAKIGTDLAGSECLEGASVLEELVKLSTNRLQ